MESGNTTKPSTTSSEAIRLDQRFAKALSSRSVSWKRKGVYDRALADCNEARCGLDPQLFEAFNNRATIRSELCEYDKALADFNDAIRLNPHNSLYWGNRSAVRRHLQRYDLALRMPTKRSGLLPQRPRDELPCSRLV